MTIETFNDTYDAVIVGARCAGAATGMLLADAGLRVLVVDKSRFGSDTMSTHALMRPAVLLLQRWGVTARLEEEGTPRVEKTSFTYTDERGRDVVEVDIEPRHGVSALYAPRRTVLDRALVDAAREKGAEVRHGVQMLDLIREDEGRVAGLTMRDASGRVREVRAGLVIGADGRRSNVARLVGAMPYVSGRHATACAFGYYEALPVDGNRWYFRPGMGAGAIPTNEGRTCVFASVPGGLSSGSIAARNQAFHDVIARTAPDIAEALPKAKLDGKLRFFPGMRGFLRQPWGEGWALVGDAGYMSDPITAHGITNALRDADILSRSIAHGESLACYQARRDDLSLEFFEVSDRVASLEWDIATVQGYHRMMSREMNREEEALVAAESAAVTVTASATVSAAVTATASATAAVSAAV